MKHRNAVRKNLLRTIKGSLGRYIAIVCIIALGSAIFVGLVSTKGDMVETGRAYMDRQHMFDLRLLSTYGWTQKEVDAVSQMAGVERAEGAVSLDAMGVLGQAEDYSVYKLHSIPQTVNQIHLMGGRMPENGNECLVDGQYASDAVLGTTFRIAMENEKDTLDSLHYHTFTVVGYVSTPLYMDISRGSTSVGNGTVAGFVYLPMDAFAMDVFTEINVCLEDRFPAYSPEYDALLSDMAGKLEPSVLLLANSRYDLLKADAEESYRQGYAEYADGLSEYETARAEAMQLLTDGLLQLVQAQVEIDENRTQLEDGLAQLDEAQALIDSQRAELEAGRIQLANGKQEAYTAFAEAYAELMANYKLVRDGQLQVRYGLDQLRSGIVQLEDGIAMLKDGLVQLEDGLEMLELAISMEQTKADALQLILDGLVASEDPDPALISRVEQELATARENLAGYQLQKEELLGMQTEYSAQLAELELQHRQLLVQEEELLQTQKTLDDSMEAIESGFLELENTQRQTENQFAAVQAQLDAGELQLQQGQAQLDERYAQAHAGMAALQQAQAELDQAYAEYEQERADAYQSFAEAKKELDDAAQQLADARHSIDTMEPAEVFVLDRNTNVGYLALNSNSDIVAGVSRVFPAFFLLVAALVCITTMTRMVEEERTQIGTFKALGYGGGAIIFKYLFYAGSAAILGCGMGTLLGSVVFPMILWNAYQIILFIPVDVMLLIDWPLCLMVVGAYTLVVLLVTWYCCHKSLREVAAELIRPKAPTSGKKVWMEYLPFWKRFSFLNKVMLRNVFRYRQRMLMMLVGVGGCTALLLTGFGLRDTIKHLVPDQFENVTTYDMQIYFSQGQTQLSQEDFTEALQNQGISAHFFYQASMELDAHDASKELNILVTDEQIRHFMNFRQDGQDLGMPGVNEAFLSVGMAEQMGISVGDQVRLRTGQMESLDVTITGIYRNNVYNYIIVAPETLQQQWGRVPLPQMAVANVAPNGDVYQAGANIGSMQDVINVTVTQDMVDQLGGMFDALDAIVVVIVICAGALAVIVCYNLTNINVTERIREIATIKVLGFRSGETAAYVFKENLLLTALGTVVGLFLGHWLLRFVISQIRVDMVWLTPSVTFRSCIISVVLTLLSAVFVDVLLYYKLEKINMAEALKSVE